MKPAKITGLTVRRQPTLTTLPIELQLEITNHLSFLGRLALRGTCRNFQRLISSPTRDDLLEVEDTDEARASDLLYCNPCNRLRRSSKFALGKMQLRTLDGVPVIKKYNRFCIDCGSRPLTGTKEDAFKYSRGNKWMCTTAGAETKYVRCNKCGGCKEADANKKGKLCKDCGAGAKQERSLAGGGKKERGIGERGRSNRGPSKKVKKEKEEEEESE